MDGEGGTRMIRVYVQLTVDVDESAWVEEFGCESLQVRKDIREFVAVSAVTAIQEEGIPARMVSVR